MIRRGRPAESRSEWRPADGVSRPRPAFASDDYQKLLRDAERAASRGNDVRAAILHTRAAGARSLALAVQAAALAAADIRRLAQRLRQALKSGRVRTRSVAQTSWRRCWRGRPTDFGTAPHGCLYDLQKVCLDSERESYVIDFLSWLLSFGRRPLKRPLPAQREVLLSKHLRVATSRVAKSFDFRGRARTPGDLCFVRRPSRPSIACANGCVRRSSRR